MRRMKGLTIIQLMVVLLVAGIIGKVVVNLLIDKRCENSSSIKLCADHRGGSDK